VDSIGLKTSVGREQLGDGRVMPQRDGSESVALLHSVGSSTLLLDRLVGLPCSNRRRGIACGNPLRMIIRNIGSGRTIVEWRRPIDVIVYGASSLWLTGWRFGFDRSGFRLLRVRPDNELLPDSNQVTIQIVPVFDLFDRHAGALRDRDKRVALPHNHDRRLGFHSGRSQRGEAHECDPERAEHPDPVYRNSLFAPRNMRKPQDVAPSTRLGILIG
jgi:hypothetical protein